MGLTTWTSLTKADLATAVDECQIVELQRQTLNPEPQYGTISQGDQKTRQVGLHGTTSSWKG